MTEAIGLTPCEGDDVKLNTTRSDVMGTKFNRIFYQLLHKETKRFCMFLYLKVL